MKKQITYITKLNLKKAGLALNPKESKLPDFEDLIRNGYFKKALTQISRIQQQQEITEEENLLSEAYRNLAMVELGNTDDTLNLINAVLKKINKLTNPNLYLVAIYIKAIILQRIGKLHKADILIEQEISKLAELLISEDTKQKIIGFCINLWFSFISCGRKYKL